MAAERAIYVYRFDSAYHASTSIKQIREDDTAMANQILLIMDYPLFVFLLTLLMLGAVTFIFHLVFKRIPPINKNLHDTFSLIQGATLTFLVFLIGFGVSLATDNYKNRQKYENIEANAINQAYLQVDFLPEKVKRETKQKLQEHLDLRLAYYQSKDLEKKENISRQINEIDNELWIAIRDVATYQQTAIMVKVLSSVNEVISSAAYTHISQLERIHPAVWLLLFILAIFCCILNSYGTVHNVNGIRLTLIFPLILAFALMFLADIDSTRGGIIFIEPLFTNNLSFNIN